MKLDENKGKKGEKKGRERERKGRAREKKREKRKRECHLPRVARTCIPIPYPAKRALGAACAAGLHHAHQV